MKTDTRQEHLLDQQLALSAYLDALLHEDTPTRVELGTAIPSVPETPVAVAGTEVEGAVKFEATDTEPGIPEWAQMRFQALLFEVAGLILAVPLARLKGVVPNEEGLTPMPGHNPLFLGIVPYQGFQSKVVDTARFVLPQGRVAQLSDDAEDRAAHLVIIDEGRWALACSRIGDVVELERTDVKWRTANGKRQWLAGTVIKKMCALLDIDELTRQLVEGMA